MQTVSLRDLADEIGGGLPKGIESDMSIIAKSGGTDTVTETRLSIIFSNLCHKKAEDRHVTADDVLLLW